MANNLIKNETNVFYTVEISEGVKVRKCEFYSGQVRRVEVTRKEDEFEKFPNEDYSKKVATYIGGSVTKHTRTEVITEVTEEIKFKGEN